VGRVLLSLVPYNTHHFKNCDSGTTGKNAHQGSDSRLLQVICEDAERLLGTLDLRSASIRLFLPMSILTRNDFPSRFDPHERNEFRK
jgi:hypothetical protein